MDIIKEKNKKRTILAFAVFAVLIILIYNIFLLIISDYDNNDAAGIFGIKAYVITTESMNPTLKKGDLILIKQCKNVKVGDIITFNQKETGEIITHRITRIEENGYITKGDDNSNEDSKIVKKEEIQGKEIIKIPWIGQYIEELKKIRYMFIIFIIIITGTLYKKRKNRKKVVRRIKKEIEDKKRSKESENTSNTSDDNSSNNN